MLKEREREQGHHQPKSLLGIETVHAAPPTLAQQGTINLNPY